MPNIQQAPAIKYNGEKFYDPNRMGKAIRTHELESAIMCGLGERDFVPMKVMLFLTGNAEGFQVAEKTILERCNISEAAYKRARQKLAEMGWITHVPGKEIIVNYFNIYNKNKGYTDDTSKGYIEYTSQRYIDDTHNNINNKINNKDNLASDKKPVEKEEGKIETTKEIINSSTIGNKFVF